MKVHVIKCSPLSCYVIVMTLFSYSYIVCFPSALDYGLDDRSSMVRFPAGTGNFSLHQCVQNGSGGHPASYPMNSRVSFPEGKAAKA
jgi:hypothetical protein